MAGPEAMLPPVEAARRLGVTRSGIHALVQQAELDDVGGQAQGHRRERRTTSGRQHASIRPLGTSPIKLNVRARPAILALTRAAATAIVGVISTGGKGAWPSRLSIRPGTA